MECKYKFHKPEHFDGKPYCTLFDELCEKCFVELGYSVCEENCQVYEDQKKYEEIKNSAGQILHTNYVLMQTHEKYDEIKERLKCKHLVLDECSLTGKNCISINECLYKHQEVLQEVKGYAQDLHHYALRLHRGYSHKIADEIDYYLDKIKQKISEVLNGQK